MKNGKNTFKLLIGMLLKIVGVSGMIFFLMVMFRAITDPAERELEVRILAAFFVLLIEGVFVGLIFWGRKIQADALKPDMQTGDTGKERTMRVRCDGCGAHVRVGKGQWTRCDHCGGKVWG